MDLLLINASLLLSYEKASVASYVSVGLKAKDVKTGPYHTWLPQALNMEIEEASELQVARDVRLAQRLFAKGEGIQELGPLDIVHLFIEMHDEVVVFSHETPDALDAIVARAGLPEHVGKIGLVEMGREPYLVDEILKSELAPRYLAVYSSMDANTDILIRRQLGILDVSKTSNRNGVVINHRGSTLRTEDSDTAMLHALEAHWSW